ncbi:MAG TPA: dienelactone hydrolase family protein [Vicinamibacterales bacterium]|nr:dienelactone hydrolase family protein [Vicinamibacterales bacterium]
MILIHGRSAAPINILSLVPAFERPEFTYLAPAAANGTWYPYSFLAERESNEPGLTSGLGVIDRLVNDVIARGVPKARVVLLGFSQGACLAAEFAASHADRYGGIIVYSGGLIGPPGTSWPYTGNFAGTPVFLGCSDADAHIPRARVAESARFFTQLGAAVTERIYPGMGHLVNEDEIAFARGVMDSVLGLVA